MSKTDRKKTDHKKKVNLFALLKPYRLMIVLLVIFTLLGSGTNLVIPRIVAGGIDAFNDGHYIFRKILTQFLGAALMIFIFSYLQSVVQTVASERVARDMREKLAGKISRQSFAFIQKANPSKLLTNLTSDMDSVKLYVAQAVSSIVSSVFVILGTCILLLTMNWRLALPVIGAIPLMGITFYLVLKRVRVWFRKSREIIDRMNRIINESILGSAIIRVINSQQLEYHKFMVASAEARDIGIAILTLFATLIPIITFLANMAILTILALGGHFVIQGSLSLGDFAAFNSYVSILIFPLIMIGFMSNLIARARASYERIDAVLTAPETADTGTLVKTLEGGVELKNVQVSYAGKPVLKEVSFTVSPGSQTAIIGPTAAGKTQLLYLLTGLIKPDGGEILFDGMPLNDYNKESLHHQVGFVFQDSVIFNMGLRENIAFSDRVNEDSLDLAIRTAEIGDFIDTLPEGLETLVSERGTSLSGGQKQRIMLARALALNPKLLLLDDFTARVDRQTEQKILCNVMNNYPDLTLISITQKIAPVRHYDQIILLMEGELVAKGKHKELLESCHEYIQIYNSQMSTSHYEV